MKKLLFIISLACLSSCCNNESTNKQTSRIKCVEIIVHNGFEYQIIEVDGIEYITLYNGGIYPLIKNDTTKN